MTQPAVYTLPSSQSWHTDPHCRALDTAQLRTRHALTRATDLGDRTACLVCADTGHDEWTLTTRNLWELWELIMPSKPYTEWDQSLGRSIVVGLTIREHRGLPKQRAAFGDTIRHHNGRYTVHPPGDPR